MTMPISALGSVGSIGSLGSVGSAGATPATSGAGDLSGAGGTNFSSALGNGLDAVEKAQSTADNLAVQAATGHLTDPAALTVAMTQAQLMTQLVTTVQSKAVAAFNTIMGMQA